ncbi:MAG: UPF0104 family protein [Planctomycetaceae bacterium]|nr:MAG: UPF0104 family protein [Planctomycetaceae bacterium]
MDKKHRKILMMVLKLGIAVGLMGWVVSQSFWRDYVTAKDGKSYALLGTQTFPDGRLEYVVAEGRLWWASQRNLSVDDLMPFMDSETHLVLENGKPIYIQPGVATSIRYIDVRLVILALGGFLLSNLMVSVRWWFLLRIQDIRIKLWEATRLTFLGIFCNIFMPSTVGGDVVKAYYVAKHTPRKAAVLVSIFVDRILGLTELTMLAGVVVAIVLLCGIESFASLHKAVYAVLIVFGLVIGLLTFLLSSRFRRLFHLQKIYQRLPIAHHIAAAGDAAALYRKRLPSLVKAIGITFGSHVVWVGSIALIGMSLPAMAAKVPWYNFFVYIPLIYIIAAVPITPGAVGVLEKLYVVFFAAVSPSTVLAMALLARFVPLVWALPGILVAVTGPKLPKAADMEAELEGEEK